MPCLGNGPSAGLWLTGESPVSYTQDRENRGFYNCVAKVLPPSQHVGDMRGPFLGQRNDPATGHRIKDLRNSRTAA